MVNLHAWPCNKMSQCLPVEIPCGLKVSRLSQQIAAATERRRLLCNSRTGYLTSIFLYFIYIFVVHRSKHWWFVNNPPVSSRGQGSTVVTNDKNKIHKYKQKQKHKNSVIDMTNASQN